MGTGLRFAGNLDRYFGVADQPCGRGVGGAHEDARAIAANLQDDLGMEKPGGGGWSMQRIVTSQLRRQRRSIRQGERRHALVGDQNDVGCAACQDLRQEDFLKCTEF